MWGTARRVRHTLAAACVLAAVSAPPSSLALPDIPEDGFVADKQQTNPIMLGGKQGAVSNPRGPGAGKCTPACMGHFKVLYDDLGFDDGENQSEPWTGTKFRMFYKRSWRLGNTAGERPPKLDFRVAWSTDGVRWYRENTGLSSASSPPKGPDGAKLNDGPGPCTLGVDNNANSQQACRTGFLSFDQLLPDIYHPRSGALAIVYLPKGKRDTLLRSPLTGTEYRYQIWFHPDFPQLPADGRRTYTGAPCTDTSMAAGCELLDDIWTAYSNNGVDWFELGRTMQVANAAGRLVTGNVRNAGTDVNAETFGPSDVLYYPNGDGPDGHAFAMYYVATHERAGSIKSRVFLAVSDDGVTWKRRDPDGGCAPAEASGCPVFRPAGEDPDGPDPSAWDADHVGWGSVIKRAGGYLMYYSGGSGGSELLDRGETPAPAQTETGNLFYRGPDGPNGPWQGIGLALSEDGIRWRRAHFPNEANLRLPSPPGEAWRSGSIGLPSVVDVRNQLQMFVLGSPKAYPFEWPPAFQDQRPMTQASVGRFFSGIVKEVIPRPLVLNDPYINAAENSQGFAIQWQAAVPKNPDVVATGADVRLIMDGQPDHEDCHWNDRPATGTIPAADVKTCLDHYPGDGTGGIAVVSKGNPRKTIDSDPTVLLFTKDLEIGLPTARFASDSDANGILESDERTGDLVVEGTGEAKATVTAVLSQTGVPDDLEGTGQVGEDGNWTIRFPPGDYARFNGGGQLAASIRQRDPAGNESQPVSLTVHIPPGIVSPPDVRLLREDGSVDDDGFISPLDGPRERIAIQATPKNAGLLELTMTDGAGTAVSGTVPDQNGEPQTRIPVAAGQAVTFAVDASQLALGGVTIRAVNSPPDGGSPAFTDLETTLDYAAPESQMTVATCPSMPGGTCYALPPVLTALGGLGLLGPYGLPELPCPPEAPTCPGGNRLDPLAAARGSGNGLEASTLIVKGTSSDAHLPLQAVYVEAINQQTGEQRVGMAYRDSRDERNNLFAKQTTWHVYFGKTRPNQASREQGTDALSPGRWKLIAHAIDVGGNVEEAGAANVREIVIYPAA